MPQLSDQEAQEVRMLLQDRRGVDSDSIWRVRVEAKVDRLGDALVMLARLEERVVTLFNDGKSVRDELDDHDERLSVLEDAEAQKRGFFGWTKEVGIAILGAAGYYAASRFLGGAPGGK